MKTYLLRCGTNLTWVFLRAPGDARGSVEYFY